MRGRGRARLRLRETARRSPVARANRRRRRRRMGIGMAVSAAEALPGCGRHISGGMLRHTSSSTSTRHTQMLDRASRMESRLATWHDGMGGSRTLRPPRGARRVSLGVEISHALADLAESCHVARRPWECHAAQCAPTRTATTNLRGAPLWLSVSGSCTGVVWLMYVQCEHFHEPPGAGGLFLVAAARNGDLLA